MNNIYEKDYPLRAISNWLFVTAGFVFAMVVIGAITRLTESGLSMVEWKPLIGALPPLNEEAWHRVFELYKQSPEYQKKNFWMGLDDFKRIFFWEWFHRLWGRLIGVVYALPYLYFLVRGQIPSQYKWPLFGLFVLGALQGLMGWYMVMSGLVDRPAVSHFRLAAHLSLAFLILSCLLWVGMKIRGIVRIEDRVLFRHGAFAMAAIATTIFWVAGLDAGLLYNEFPKMGEGIVPQELFFGENSLIWQIFHDPASVQFVHRWMGVITGLIVLSFTGHAMFRGETAWCFMAVGLVVILQIALGIGTLLSGVQIHMAVTHQAGALTLLALMVICFFKCARH